MEEIDKYLDVYERMNEMQNTMGMMSEDYEAILANKKERFDKALFLREMEIISLYIEVQEAQQLAQRSKRRRIVEIIDLTFE